MKATLKTKILAGVVATATAFSALMPNVAQAQASEPYVGQMQLFGNNFCPRSWANADGQILAIASNDALFSLLGTYYGGDGRTTFALPDLRGRYPMHVGSGPGLTPFTGQGTKAGSERVTLTTPNQMAAHNHTIQSTDLIASKKGPGSDFLAKVDNIGDAIYHDGPPNKLMDPAMITSTGSSQPIPQRDPLLVMRWCISLTGIYPSRN